MDLNSEFISNKSHNSYGNFLQLLQRVEQLIIVLLVEMQHIFGPFVFAFGFRSPQHLHRFFELISLGMRAQGVQILFQEELVHDLVNFGLVRAKDLAGVVPITFFLQVGQHSSIYNIFELLLAPIVEVDSAEIIHVDGLSDLVAAVSVGTGVDDGEGFIAEFLEIFLQPAEFSLDVVDGHEDSCLAVEVVLPLLEGPVFDCVEIAVFEVDLGDSEFKEGFGLGHPADFLEKAGSLAGTPPHYLDAVDFLLQVFECHVEFHAVAYILIVVLVVEVILGAVEHFGEVVDFPLLGLNLLQDVFIVDPYFLVDEVHDGLGAFELFRQYFGCHIFAFLYYSL